MGNILHFIHTMFIAKNNPSNKKNEVTIIVTEDELLFFLGIVCAVVFIQGIRMRL